MLVRNLPRSFLLPVAATILCLIAASAAALDVTFTKIIDTDTPAPGHPEASFLDFSYPIPASYG